MLLRLHLFLHAPLHLPELLFKPAAGDINRNDQFKNQLVSEIDQYSVENVLHGTKIGRHFRRLPGFNRGFTGF